MAKETQLPKRLERLFTRLLIWHLQNMLGGLKWPYESPALIEKLMVEKRYKEIEDIIDDKFGYKKTNWPNSI